MVRWGFFIENLEIGNIVYVIIRVCECVNIKDGDTDEVKDAYYCGLRCDHPAAAASFFRKSVRVQPDAGEACAGEQQPGFGFQPDGL